ncbi:hypothetical protein HQ393_04600 [Chitinibacter bivalviorum]|uniref:Uncharacterized protein n=1 Tax=Chitinibacter bivalviorum TaxID=2739434 RepID=A0A7H9BI19_9NEIS|nr:hypothetical protein [Chitinibacter bivalviorum]QLG87591.1 hypothetical protein HQ393_04600 [Chitinibacter bivalviorum]
MFVQKLAVWSLGFFMGVLAATSGSLIVESQLFKHGFYPIYCDSQQ